MCNLETLPRLRRARGELEGKYILETATFSGRNCYHVNEYKKGKLLQTSYIDSLTKESFLEFGTWLNSVRFEPCKISRRIASFQDLNNRIHQKGMTDEEAQITSCFVPTNISREGALSPQRIFLEEGKKEEKVDDDDYDEDCDLPFAIKENYFSSKKHDSGSAEQSNGKPVGDEDLIFGSSTGIAHEALMKEYNRKVREKKEHEEPFLL